MKTIFYRLDAQYNTINYLYTPSYTRIAPYFVGAYIGYFLSHYERKLNMKKVLPSFSISLVAYSNDFISVDKSVYGLDFIAPAESISDFRIHKEGLNAVKCCFIWCI